MVRWVSSLNDFVWKKHASILSCNQSTQAIARASKCLGTFMDLNEISSFGGTSVFSTEPFGVIPIAAVCDYHLENSWFRSSLVPFTCFYFTKTELVRRDFEGSKALCSGWKSMGIVCLISICAFGKSPSNWLNICTIGCGHGGTMWLSNHLFSGTKTHWQQTLIGRSSPRLVYISWGCRGQNHEGKQRHRISRK